MIQIQFMTLLIWKRYETLSVIWNSFETDLWFAGSYRVRNVQSIKPHVNVVR